MDAVTATARPDLEKAQVDIRRLEAASGDYADLAELAGPHARERWQAMTVTGRRRLLEKLRVQVTIRRTGKRGPGFDPDGVRIERV